MKNDKYVVGVDVGGQTTKIGIVNKCGEIIIQKTITSIYGVGEADLFMDSICDTIRILTDGIGLNQIKGIGIGVPNGNYYTGIIEDAANLNWAKGKSICIAKYISDNLGLYVTITDDANAAAIGEMKYGAARGMKNFIMITLGTGVGSGIVINGELVYGHDGFAGELGHVTVVWENGRSCSCGKCGCLEAYTSAMGVAHTAKAAIKNGNEPSLLREVEDITSKDVYEAAVKGDKLAKEIFEYTGKILGQCLADFVAFSSPQAIILFGGLARAGELLLKPTKEAMEANLLPIWKNKIELIPTALNESDAAILGASALAW